MKKKKKKYVWVVSMDVPGDVLMIPESWKTEALAKKRIRQLIGMYPDWDACRINKVEIK